MNKNLLKLFAAIFSIALITFTVINYPWNGSQSQIEGLYLSNLEKLESNSNKL